MEVANILEKHQDNLKKLNAAVEVIKHDSEYFRRELDTCTREKLEKIVFDQFVMHSNKLMKNLNEELIKNKKELDETENYIAKYLPFKMMNYIHDCMKAVLPGKPFMKLLNFMSNLYQYHDYQVKCDDGRGRLNKREYQMPELEKEQEEYKDRQDDFMTGVGGDPLFARLSISQMGERQRKGSDFSNEGGEAVSKENSPDKAPHKSQSMIIGQHLAAKFRLSNIKSMEDNKVGKIEP